jgi:hypothetical protein
MKWQTRSATVLLALIGWCAVSSADTCDLCKHPFTIILGTGRSGSTTLLEMLNQLDGYALTGEHAAMMVTLMDLHKRFLRTQEATNKGYVAWKHSERKESTHFCWMQSWFVNNDDGKVDTIYGFKVSHFHFHFSYLVYWNLT